MTIQEAHYGQNYWQVASTLVNLANAHGALGDAATQKTLLLRALPILKAHYGQEKTSASLDEAELGAASSSSNKPTAFFSLPVKTLIKENNEEQLKQQGKENLNKKISGTFL